MQVQKTNSKMTGSSLLLALRVWLCSKRTYNAQVSAMALAHVMAQTILKCKHL
jgi:hypothetical protein